MKWALELGEYDIQFRPQSAIKGQALANFIIELTPQSTFSIMEVCVLEIPFQTGN